MKEIENNTEGKQTDNVIRANFAPPKKQSELNGKMGMSTAGIAKILGIPASRVRRKLERGGMIERLETCNFTVFK